MGIGGGGDAENFFQDCCIIVIDDRHRMGIPCPGPASHPLMVHYIVVVMVSGQGTHTRAGSSTIQMAYSISSLDPGPTGV